MTARITTLTLARLREVLSYDAQTGVFTWRQDRPCCTGKVLNARAGDAAGCVTKAGYVLIGIDGFQYKAHQLAWLYVSGQYPTQDLDHRDTNKANNAFANLRELPLRHNTENRRKANANNGTGLLGVSRRGRRYRARIGVAGHYVQLGTFDTAEAAHAAYLTAKRQFHAGCTL